MDKGAGGGEAAGGGADVEDVHVVARLDGAQHWPEPSVGDHRHRADGGHAVDGLEAGDDRLAQLAARLCAEVGLLEQVKRLFWSDQTRVVK